MGVIFISHPTKDRALADALVCCIHGCMVAPEGAIRCTSDERYNLTPGERAGVPGARRADVRP